MFLFGYVIGLPAMWVVHVVVVAVAVAVATEAVWVSRIQLMVG